MVRISKIYTKTGDSGTTGLVDGSRISKDDPRVEAYGEVDELNAHLGLIRTIAQQSNNSELCSKLELIQNELFDIGSYLATPAKFSAHPVFKVENSHIENLEAWIDQITEVLPPLKSFVLPGGTELNAHLHLARTVCRRAERRIVSLSKSQEVDEQVIVYINRLSDLLFALSRQATFDHKSNEYLWIPATKRK